MASPHGQAVFFRAKEDFEVPTHSHGAQWGVVVSGILHLTIDGEPGTYEPGETYDIPAGAEHSARLEAGSCVIDVFQEPDRYSREVTAHQSPHSCRANSARISRMVVREPRNRKVGR